MYVYTTKEGKNYRIYDDFDEFEQDWPQKVEIYRDKKRKYMMLGCGFDIETTLVNRHSFMYHGQVCVGDQIYLFRHWICFELFMERLNKYCKKHECNIICWVANLGYEFSYICRRIKINKVFAKEERHPITVNSGRVQFRDCLTVAGQGGLANLAKNFCTTRKLKGDLDYSVTRNSTSKLSKKEVAYCINDVAILSEWADYCHNRWIKNGVGHIPLTITGICREEVKKAAGSRIDKIRKLVHDCYPKTKEQYDYMMLWLFRGGYTHANIYHVSCTVDNVVGVDFTSSYPAVMMHFKYPISPFVETTISTDGRLIDDVRITEQSDTFACWMIVELYGIEAKTLHSIESKHKIIEEYHASYDNGRLMSADYIRVALTEVDYRIYTMFYRWEKMHIVQAHLARKGALPDYLIKPLMDAYQTKTRLKRTGQDGTVEYKNAKTMVNSFYGMTVTRLSFTDWTFDLSAKGLWREVDSKRPYWHMIKDQILLPQWGIWITAYARESLLEIVHEMDPDRDHNNVLYCDTDSIYFVDSERCRDIIERYNMLCYYVNRQFPPEFDDIGCFDYIDNGKRYRFKTLGAKRYIKLDGEGHTTVTVAGLRRGTYERTVSTSEPPSTGEYVYVTVEHDDGTKERRYLSVDDFFDRFDPMLLLTAEQSGKLAALYHNDTYSADVDGECMQELSGCALVGITFKFSLDSFWLRYALEIQKKLHRSDIYG